MSNPEEFDSLQDHHQNEDAQKNADERFAHGLLITGDEDPATDLLRIQRVMRQIRSDQATTNKTSRAFSLWGIASGIAAILFFGVGLFLLNATQQSARATIAETISATETAGDRTYRLSFTNREGGVFKSRTSGTLDVRSDNQYVFMDKTPEGHMLVAGADAEGQWMIDRLGRVLRNPPKKYPSWVDIGGNSLLMASIDGMLDTLHAKYDLESLQPEELEEGDSTRCIRIKAIKLTNEDTGPEQVDLWIDEDSNLVRRMEIVLGDTPFNDRMREHPLPPRNGRRPAIPPHPGRGGNQPPLQGERNMGRPPPHHGRMPHLPGAPRGAHNLHAVRFDLEARNTLADDWFRPEAHSTR
jgi:hypothetical protein